MSVLFCLDFPNDLAEARLQHLAAERGVKVVHLEQPLKRFSDQELKDYLAKSTGELFLLENVPTERLGAEFLGRVVTLRQSGHSSPLSQFCLLMGIIPSRVDLLIPTYVHNGVQGLHQSGASPEEIEFILDLQVKFKKYSLEDVCNYDIGLPESHNPVEVCEVVRELARTASYNSQVYSFYRVKPVHHEVLIDRVLARDPAARIVFSDNNSSSRGVVKAWVYTPGQISLSQHIGPGRRYAGYTIVDDKLDPKTGLWYIYIVQNDVDAKLLNTRSLTELVSRA